MQDSYWIAPLGFIMVSFKTNSLNAEPINTSDPGVPVSKKKLSLFQYSIVFPEVLFLEKLKWRKKKYLYNKYAALNITRTNATKGGKYFVATPGTQLFLPTKPERKV